MEVASQELVDTLARLRQRIEGVQKRRSTIGEPDTKAALIEPLLSALGWDVRDLSSREVIREYRHQSQDNPVDYALFIMRSPCLFVEAKALAADLGDRKWVRQVLSYATDVGVEWCVLTNGDEYRLYNAHAPVELEKKLFRRVQISDPTQYEHTLCTLDLLSKDKMGGKVIDNLWKAHFVDYHVKSALESLLTSENSSLVGWIRKKRPELARSDIKESLKRADIQIEFPAVTLTSFPLRETATKTSGKTRKPTSHKVIGVSVSDLIKAGLIDPPLDLEKSYKGASLAAVIQQDGTINFGGQSYNSLSTAAGMARKSVIGAPTGRPYPQTDGWIFWRYRDKDTGVLKKIDGLRQLFLKRKSELQS